MRPSLTGSTAAECPAEVRPRRDEHEQQRHRQLPRDVRQRAGAPADAVAQPARPAGDGDREAKAFHATTTYLGPIVDGAVTSFLGFLALAFAKYQYIQLYYFQLYSIILLCGLLVGAIMFPALLATAGEQ